MINIKKNIYILFLLFLIYFISRYLFYEFLQIKADLQALKPGWHVLELDYLNKDLFNSILYLHSQPPLWNMIIGFFTKIVNGDLQNTTILLNLFNYILTLGIIFYSFKILKEFNIGNSLSFFLVLILIIFNPNIIFFENIVIYNHLLSFLFTNLFWLTLKFFKTKKNLYEILLYSNICIQSFIWAGMHPVILIFFFIVISYQKKSLSNIGSIFFSIILIISTLPLIKNKIIFNKFSNSTWIGINLASTLNNALDDPWCLYQVIYPYDIYEEYKLKYNREINHPVARLKSGHAYRNSVSYIIFSDKCLSKSLKQIKDTPFKYLKGRFIAALVSHSKFGFEYIYFNPKNFNFNNFFDDKKYFKIIKQISVTIYMMIFYYFLISKSLKKNIYRKEYVLIFLTYIFCNIISHLFNGYEHERFMYQFHILHVVVIGNLIFSLNEKISKK